MTRIKVIKDRPSKFSDPREVLRVCRENGKKEHSYSDREIAGWCSVEDKKQHSPAMIGRKMKWLYEHDRGVAKSVDSDTGEFVGWRLK